MMEESNSFHQITLTQKIQKLQHEHTSGYSFRSLQKDFQTIYNHFSLLSYFTPQCGIIILDRYPHKTSPKIEIDKFEIKSYNEKKSTDEKEYYLLFQEEKDEYKPKGSFKDTKLTIKYSVGTSAKDTSGQYRITVVFTTQVKHQRQYIHILIKDSDKWIQNTFSKKINQFSINRHSQNRVMKENELEYLYQEPQAKRNKKMGARHFSIALQGGGVKGVAYVGAYKAVKKQEPDIPIKTIIGSSAGSMLGVAICCNMTQKQITDLCKDVLSLITKDQKYKSESRNEIKKVQNAQKVQDSQELLNIVKSFLVKFGIVRQQVIDLIKDVITDKQFNDGALELIKAFNPEIMKLFTVGNPKDKLSILGLLKGALMTGSTIRQFAAKCILSLRIRSAQTDYEPWEKPMQEERAKIIQKIKESQKKKIMDKKAEQLWAENITLKQLYELTGTQFTCTAVDITDYVLRFFNHKTTPNLPVCIAVQMSGSFPVAFQAQKWSTKSWGKYYIHYDNCRRQVDLEGHQFTDGGVLANFPVKYLDNEYMRPMYFSHVKVDFEQDPQKFTLMYGFGLNAVKPAVDLSKQVKKFGDICSRLVSSKVGILNGVGKFLKHYIWFSPKDIQIKDTTKVEDNPLEAIRKLPLIKFILQLANTYIKTKDNLTEECFAHRSFETAIGEQYLQMMTRAQSKKEIENNLRIFSEDFKRLLIEPLQSKNKKDIYDNLIENSQYIITILKKKLSYSEDTVHQFARILKPAFSILSIIQIIQLIKKPQLKSDKYQLPGPQVREKFRQQIIDLDVMQKSKIFSYQKIKQDHHRLIQIISNLQNWLQEMYKTSREKLLNIIQIIRNQQRQKIQSAYYDFEQYRKKLAKLEQYQPMEPQIVYNIYLTKRWAITASLEKNLQFQNKIKRSKVPQLFISFEAFKNQTHIENYVTKLLIEGERVPEKKATGIHIILESIMFSELYFNEYFGAIENAILNYNIRRNKQIKVTQSSQTNYQQLKITSMTASNYHSLVMFLYVCGFPAEDINKDVWKIDSLIKQSEILKKKTITKDDLKGFAQTNTTRIKSICDNVWETRFNAFQGAEKILKQNYGKNPKEEVLSGITNLQFETINSEERISQSIQSSLNYIVDELMTLEGKQITDKDLITVSQKLIINLNENNTKKQVAKEKIAYNLLQFLSQRYIDLTNFFFFSSSYINEQILSIRNEDYRKHAWRSLLTTGILHSLEIKRFISEKLGKIGLRSDATLSQLYDFTRGKILLNFAVIQSQSKTIRFYNHVTKPNIPVWAAVTASCCLPDFFNPLPDRASWNFNPNKNQNDRLVKQYFADNKKSTNYLSSADIITKLPLELITNSKLKSKITNTQNEIYLAFNFADVNFKTINTKMVPKITSKAMGLIDLKNNADNLSGISSLLDLPGLQSITNRFSTYSSSHDNLITELYKCELIKLPIRVQTLDFDKILDGNQLSPVIKDTLIQSEYVMKQKLNNSGLKDGDNDNHMYFAIESGRDQKADITFRHLAALNPTNNLYEKYKIFYRLKENEPYLELVGQRLPLKFQADLKDINLRFVYPKTINSDSKQKLPFVYSDGAKLAKVIRYHSLDMSNLINFFKDKDPQQQLKFVYLLKFNHHQEQIVALKPDYPQKTPEQVDINYKSYLEPDSAHPHELVCDICDNNNVQKWHIIKGQELLSQILSLKSEEASQKLNGQKNARCSSPYCQNKEHSEYIMRYIYRCLNCQAIYCVNCKYSPFVNKQSEILCPLNHKMDRFDDEKSKMQGKLKFVQCDLCQGYNSSYFMHDETCDAHVCEGCLLLNLFKKGAL